MKQINNISIDIDLSILDALKKMDELKRKLLIVLEREDFKSLLSIGDIQRALIKGKTLNSTIRSIIRPNVKVVYENDNISAVKDLMKEKRNEFMPILSASNKVLDVIFWEVLFDTKKQAQKIPKNLPVIIMAGGKGTRLKPLTNVLPKPLIPIGEKTISEDIMDQFVAVGCNHFYLSVNYKADMIRHYFKTLNNSDYIVEFIQEDYPLGTAGSLYLLKDKIKSSFFVSNCDIIVEQELFEVYNYHKKNRNDITIVSALKHYPIPYGTLESSKNGILKSLSEKPQLTFQINTGLYLLEAEILKLISDNEFLHITELVNKVKSAHGRVGVFPVSEGSWKDIGEWKGYLSTSKINNFA